MYIDNALNLAYSYAEKICNQAELDLVSDELIKIAGKTDEYTFRKDDMKYSYSETQNMLSKLNEKESIRKEFGNLTKSNATIDNEYIGKFLDDLRKEFGY